MRHLFNSMSGGVYKATLSISLYNKTNILARGHYIIFENNYGDISEFVAIPETNGIIIAFPTYSMKEIFENEARLYGAPIEAAAGMRDSIEISIVPSMLLNIEVLGRPVSIGTAIARRLINILDNMSDAFLEALRMEKRVGGGYAYDFLLTAVAAAVIALKASGRLREAEELAEEEKMVSRRFYEKFREIAEKSGVPIVRRAYDAYKAFRKLYIEYMYS